MVQDKAEKKELSLVFLGLSGFEVRVNFQMKGAKWDRLPLRQARNGAVAKDKLSPIEKVICVYVVPRFCQEVGSYGKSKGQ